MGAITKCFIGSARTSAIEMMRSRAPCSMFTVSSFSETHQKPNNDGPNLNASYHKSENRESRFAIMASRAGNSAPRGLFENVEMKMKAKARLRVNDLVRVVQSGGTPGPTLYLLEWIGERGYCVIREAGNPLAGGQEFDLSMLVKADRDPPVRKRTPLDALFGDF